MLEVRDLQLRISSMEECQNALERLSEREREPYFKDMFDCSVKMLGEYKELLMSRIENAELKEDVDGTSLEYINPNEVTVEHLMKILKSYEPDAIIVNGKGENVRIYP